GEVWKNAMPKNRMSDATNVRRRNCEPSIEQRVSLGAEYERLSRARSGAPPDVILHQLRGIGRIRARRAGDVRRITKRGIRGGNLAHQPLEFLRLRAVEYWRENRIVHRGRSAKNSDFLIGRRISDANVEEKTVELRFGKRIGSLLLDRIL